MDAAVGFNVVRTVVVGGRVGLTALAGLNQAHGQDCWLKMQFFVALKSEEALKKQTRRYFVVVIMNMGTVSGYILLIFFNRYDFLLMFILKIIFLKRLTHSFMQKDLPCFSWKEGKKF
jgi:hypothetical protein